MEDKRHWERFFSEQFGFPLPLPFHHLSILIFIHTLFLPERRTGEA
jgi:hypothetical protein